MGKITTYHLNGGIIKVEVEDFGAGRPERATFTFELEADVAEGLSLIPPDCRETSIPPGFTPEQIEEIVED